jgi:hypothetical protein
MDTGEFVLVVFCFILTILITLTFCKYNPYCHFNNYVVPDNALERGNGASNLGWHHESKVGPHSDALNVESNTVIRLSGITIEPSVPSIDDLFNSENVRQLIICPVNEDVITII